MASQRHTESTSNADARATQSAHVGDPACTTFASRRLDDEAYMRLAIDEAEKAGARGEVPIGAVVVYDPIDPATRKPLNAEPRVVAFGQNVRESKNDPAGHAEFVAMKRASEALGAWRLTGCTVYVTLEPCIMCAGLMHQARIDRCVYGAADPKAGALGTLYSIHTDERLNHIFPATPGVLESECAALLKAFFKQRRRKGKGGAKAASCSDASAPRNASTLDAPTSFENAGAGQPPRL